MARVAVSLQTKVISRKFEKTFEFHPMVRLPSFKKPLPERDHRLPVEKASLQ